MIRPFTLITMLLAALSGAYLFAVKHRAQVLDDQISAFSQSSRLDAMRIRVLQGQWSLETDPTRLQQLAAQFTALQPMQPAQLVTLATLRESLPPAGSAAPASNPELPGQTVPQIAVPEVAQNTMPGALPLPPPMAPVLLASAAPTRPAAPLERRTAARRVSHSALHLANTELAEALPPPKPFYTPAPRESAADTRSSVITRSELVGAQVVSVKATATVPQYAPPVMAAQNSGSALGMAGNLPPPQPMPSGSDN